MQKLIQWWFSSGWGGIEVWHNKQLMPKLPSFKENLNRDIVLKMTHLLPIYFTLELSKN